MTSGEIPEETAGPCPGDGSNGPDVLGESGVVAAVRCYAGRGPHVHFEVYESVANLAAVSLDSDGVVSDGHSLQMATMTGTVADGLVATSKVPV